MISKDEVADNESRNSDILALLQTSDAFNRLSLSDVVLSSLHGVRDLSL